MRDRALRWLDVGGGATLVLYAPAALVLLGARTLLARERPAIAWLVPWAGLFVVGLLNLSSTSGAGLLAQAAAGALAGTLLVAGSRRRLLVGLGAGLALTLAAGLIERELTRRVWVPEPAAATVGELLAGVSRVSGDEPSWTRNGVGLVEKRWTVPTDASELVLSFEARAVAGEAGWQWYTNSPLTRQERLVENGVPLTQLTGFENYVARRVRLGEPLGGARVRVVVDLRAAESAASEGCGLIVRTFEPSFSECAPISVGQEWRRHELEVAFPIEMEQTTFEVTLAALDVMHLDIRGLEVAWAREEEWRPVQAVEPAGVHVRFPQAGTHVFSQTSLSFVPDAEWRAHGLELEPTGGVVSALLQVEAGTVVELRHLSLTTPDGRSVRPMAAPRLDLWSADPNLAGHAWASAGLSGQALAASPVASAGVLASSLVLQALAASRTAFFAALPFGALLLFLALPRRRRAPLAVLLAVAAALAIAALAASGTNVATRLLALSDENAVTRTEIWTAAAQTIRASPLTGAGSFAAAWRDLHPDDARTAPTHAHDLWLDLGAAHGVPGLAAGAWLAAALVALAWRWGRWRGLLLVLPLLAMNLIDTTLFTAGVLYPAVAALNLLRRDGSQ